MAPPRELDIKRMVKARESNGFDENGGSFVALKWVGTEGTHWWSSMSEIVEFVMGPVLGVLGILGMIYVLLIKPAYQRMVQKKGWGEILGHAQEDANHGEDA